MTCSGSLAQQAVVHVNGDQVLPNGPDQQSRADRAVHAAGKSEQHLAVSNLGTDGPDLFFNKGFRQRGGRDPFEGFRTLVGIHGFPPIFFIHGIRGSCALRVSRGTGRAGKGKSLPDGRTGIQGEEKGRKNRRKISGQTP